MLKGYLEKSISESNLQLIISSAILKNKIEVIDFVSRIKNLKDFSFSYKSSSIKDKNVKFICSKLGFRYFSNGDGTRRYSIDPLIDKFYQDVILCFD